MIYYGRSEKEAAVQGGAVLSSGESDRASGVLLRRGGEEPLCRVADASRQAQVQVPTLRACMRINYMFTATYSPGSDPLKSNNHFFKGFAVGFGLGVMFMLVAAIALFS